MTDRARSMVSTQWCLPLLVVFASGLIAGVSLAEEPDDRPPRQAPRFYLSGLVGGSWVNGDATGTTTLGESISGSSSSSSVFGGAALGTTLDLRHVDLRLELEGTGGRSFDFTHPSTVNTYGTSADVWTFQGNFWFEYPLRKLLPDTPIVRELAPFAGGGVGLSGVSMKTSGGALTGSNDSINFAWQAGAGLSYQPLPWLALDVRYQYADFGGPKVPLQGGGNGGSLQVDLGANEVVGVIRFTFAEL
jgi:opacity protein-like surface antigen